MPDRKPFVLVAEECEDFKPSYSTPKILGELGRAYMTNLTTWRAWLGEIPVVDPHNHWLTVLDETTGKRFYVRASNLVAEG